MTLAFSSYILSGVIQIASQQCTQNRNLDGIDSVWTEAILYVEENYRFSLDTFAINEVYLLDVMLHVINLFHIDIQLKQNE
jgi:hypothetical protein